MTPMCNLVLRRELESKADRNREWNRNILRSKLESESKARPRPESRTKEKGIEKRTGTTSDNEIGIVTINDHAEGGGRARTGRACSRCSPAASATSGAAAAKTPSPLHR
ncbi:hypothetical protein EVAR_57903_1 [Eumeta japonica]|uniref:Uncharacterized protein n=1 Tax=Eumeta variegata TaxID=151549 RepID=A0A4C1YR61_EUMVA|nr:hypothetical protein EVAR_57903_1 [Eumeta japonica]